MSAPQRSETDSYLKNYPINDKGKFNLGSIYPYSRRYSIIVFLLLKAMTQRRIFLKISFFPNSLFGAPCIDTIQLGSMLMFSQMDNLPRGARPCDVSPIRTHCGRNFAIATTTTLGTGTAEAAGQTIAAHPHARCR